MHYSIIRYVPDADRMEPTNVGLLLTEPAGTRVRFYPHAAKRKHIDQRTLGQWREFLKSEIEGPAVPLFQPERSHLSFLNYLATLCTGNVRLSEPLYVHPSSTETASEIFEDLYRRLVVPSEEAEVNPTRVTGRFRQIAEEKRFNARGLKKNALVEVSLAQHFFPYRQFKNGHVLAIDKVEFGAQLGATLGEVAAAQRASAMIRPLIEGKGEYFLMIDECTRFRGQSEQEFDMVRRDVDEVANLVQEAGATVVRSEHELTKLGTLLDQTLPFAPE
jgi:Protein of unknown function (DUF3037)